MVMTHLRVYGACSALRCLCVVIKCLCGDEMPVWQCDILCVLVVFIGCVMLKCYLCNIYVIVNCVCDVIVNYMEACVANRQPLVW